LLSEIVHTVNTEVGIEIRNHVLHTLHGIVFVNLARIMVCILNQLASSKDARKLARYLFRNEEKHYYYYSDIIGWMHDGQEINLKFPKRKK